MKYIKYSKEEFDKWCEDHFIEDNMGLWEFVKDQEINLNIEKDDTEEPIFCLKLKLREV